MKKNITPVLLLLLDDIFDKVDDHRVGYILSLIEKNKLRTNFLLQTPSKEKIPNILKKLNIPSKLCFGLKNGNSSKIISA